MAILQALLTLISKSAGKLLNAVFGWAVVALFGRGSSKQQTMLSILVGLAAAWPVLLVGIAFPKVTAAIIAFVPLSSRVPSWVVRVVWAALALSVPLTIGLVVASKAPPGSPAEPFIKRALRGFPITIGVAGAFLMMFVTVPALRLASIIRRREDEHVPISTTGDEYQDVTAKIDQILKRHGLDAPRGRPTWWLVGPSRILQKMGGAAMRGFLPNNLSYWRGPSLELALYPSDLLIRGEKVKLAWAHGLLAEGLARGPGFQTLDADAQRVEKEIHRIWSLLDEDPEHHRNSHGLTVRLNEIAEELVRIPIPYDEWQVLYRQLLQLARALHGEGQMLDRLVVAGRAPHQQSLIQRLLAT